MPRHYGTFARNSQPVAIFSGLRASTVAGNIASYAAPPARLGAVRRTEGNFAAEVGPITMLGMAEATRLGAARSQVMPRRYLGANPMNYGPGGAPVRLGQSGMVASIAAAGPGGLPVRLGMDVMNRVGPGGIPARLGANPMNYGPGGAPVRLGASIVAGNIASNAAPPVRLGASTVAGNIASYAAPPTRLGRYFGALGQDDAEFVGPPEPTREQAQMGYDEEESDDWSPEQITAFIKALTGGIAPIITATGGLINPRTGQPLSPQQAELYRRYEENRRREESMPKWLLPVGIAAAVGVVAIVLLKK